MRCVGNRRVSYEVPLKWLLSYFDSFLENGMNMEISGKNLIKKFCLDDYTVEKRSVTYQKQ